MACKLTTAATLIWKAITNVHQGEQLLMHAYTSDTPTQSGWCACLCQLRDDALYTENYESFFDMDQCS